VVEPVETPERARGGCRSAVRVVEEIVT
jgi:hypothetical protein